MEVATVSPEFQIVIPKAVRERTGITPGEKLQVLCFDDRIERMRTRPMREMRGYLRGMDPAFGRDEDDHFQGLPGVNYKHARTTRSSRRARCRAQDRIDPGHQP